ncbi:putative feruloyl esterase b protein [Phaeoacremonium minimum UCRPA7]|uniref:Carboxylic ester hydrolase n=1 Tax=Phaeoacremonium minimum (strain UCR-PA7) TaxID=1286976 RepID=R8BSZ5_PHAM7|nr:putative feruloyl esterase b protein [Phaeoacremonium minimum UCRPA7]EOO02395.1 putative feruloyl esterase b protein [Phaeoacremonium minimum UCRPA7]
MQPWTTKIATYNLPKSNPKAIPPQLFAVIAAEVINQCDAVDGVSDGIVSAPDLCQLDLSVLHCDNERANASACLSSLQLETVEKIYGDYYADGKFAFPGLEVGSEAQWAFLLGGDAPSTLGDGYSQYFLLDDPNWTWKDYTDDIVWKADAEDPGNCTADHFDRLKAVKQGNSKILMYHGMADALIAQRSSNVFYDRVAEAFGGQHELQSWFRFFLVPGMQHVTGTPVKAPWYFAGANSQGVLGTDVYSTPGFEDAQHDALLALMDWVEKGTPVDQLIATTWINQTVPSSGVLRQRPLCPYPQRATYNGIGDVDIAESWSCKIWNKS